MPETIRSKKMSVYEEFGKNQELKDYHKAALGLSWTPERLGRYWWQRNSYMLGGYFIHSGIDVKNVDINTYAITFGSQIPFTRPVTGSFSLAWHSIWESVEQKKRFDSGKFAKSVLISASMNSGL